MVAHLEVLSRERMVVRARRARVLLHRVRVHAGPGHDVRHAQRLAIKPCAVGSERRAVAFDALALDGGGLTVTADATTQPVVPNAFPKS